MCIIPSEDYSTSCAILPFRVVTIFQNLLKIAIVVCTIGFRGYFYGRSNPPICFSEMKMKPALLLG